MIPVDDPKWRTIYAYFCKWNARPSQGEPSLLERVLKKCVGAVRARLGKLEKTSLCILDAQRVKNTDSAEKKGYGTGKKVSGIKRPIVVDSQGLIHAIALTPADIMSAQGLCRRLNTLKRI